MSLIVTPGAANANSYANLDEFEIYAANRLPAVAWFADANDDQKEAALIAACRELDADFDWTGTAVDSVQALNWPRSGMLTKNGFSIPTNVNPQQLKDAQCEFALQLGSSDRLGDNDPLKKGITSLRAGSVALTFSDIQGGRASTYEGADIIIRREQSDLNYVSDVVPAEVRRLLVPSWFNQSSIRRPVTFKAF